MMHVTFGERERIHGVFWDQDLL